MAFQLPRHPEAFSLGRGKKRPRREERDHLTFIRDLPSCISGKRPCDPCHIRFGDLRYGKRETGVSEKPSDQWVLPLTRAEHDDQHSGNERAFWARHGIDPLALALKLYGCSGDDEAAEIIIRDSIALAATMRAMP